MTDSSFPQDKWRNRPGRDILIALGLCYLALVAFGLAQVFDPAVLANTVLTMMMVPVGLFMTIMQTTLMSAFSLGALVAVGVVLTVRMPGYVRVPLLVIIFGAMFYSSIASGFTL